MLGLLGKKKGMTQVIKADGEMIPVTVIELGPCTVVECKTKEKHGYTALQLGFCVAKRPSNVTKAMRGHYEKKGLPIYTELGEFRCDCVENFKVGDELCVTGFKPGDLVDIRGTVKGRGFQGVMKRHGKHGGPAAHGSDFHRRPGSIGMRAWPGRVFKNMKLPGHMGTNLVTTQNLEVVDVRADDNVILVKGAVAGTKSGLVMVSVREDKTLADRAEFKRSNIVKLSDNNKSGEAA